MSVEDLDPDFVSDDSDHEAEETVTDGDTDEANYQELVHLHNSLMSFDHIYTNNTIMDTEYADEAQLSLDLDSVHSALNLIQDYIHSAFEDVSSSSATSSDDRSSSDTEDSSLNSSPASESTDGQMTNSENTENAQDEVTGWQL